MIAIALTAVLVVPLVVAALIGLVTGLFTGIREVRSSKEKAEAITKEALSAGKDRFRLDAPDQSDPKHVRESSRRSAAVTGPIELTAQPSSVVLPPKRQFATSEPKKENWLIRFLFRMWHRFRDDYEASEAERKLRKATINQENWYAIASLSCGDTVDALLNQKQGRSVRVINSLAAKLGFAGATTGLFSIASVFGTAGTGTAISTLSGAAFNSAALKWLGGGVSMAVGGWVVFLVSLVAGAIAYIFARLTFEKHFGRRRKLKRLDAQEKRVVGTLMLIAVGFRKQSEQAIKLNPTSALALKLDLFDQLVNDLALCATKVDLWPPRPRNKLDAQLRRICELRDVLERSAHATSQMKQNKVSGASQVDVVSVVMLKLLSKPIPHMSEDEERVCTALRKSKRKLKKASNQMLSEYVRLEQLSRLKDRLKKVRRIYAKLAKEQGSDHLCEEYTVAFVESPDQVGVEVLALDQRTKTASSFGIAPSESANEDEVASFKGQQDMLESEIVENLSLAAVITLARNAGAYLSGHNIRKKDRQKLIDQSIQTASVWGLSELIV